MMLVMMGGGGRFKEVVMDGGVGDRMGKMFEGRRMWRILLGWIVGGVLRI